MPWQPRCRDSSRMSTMGSLVAEGFGGVMVAEAAVTHLSTLRETTLDDSVSVDPPHVANPSTVSPAES